jgi:hypothetical protein
LTKPTILCVNANLSRMCLGFTTIITPLISLASNKPMMMCLGS